MAASSLSIPLQVCLSDAQLKRAFEALRAPAWSSREFSSIACPHLTAAYEHVAATHADELARFPREGSAYLWGDYYVRVTGAQPHARGWQVQFYLIGLARFDSAGLSEFMRSAQPQPLRY